MSMEQEAVDKRTGQRAMGAAALMLGVLGMMTARGGAQDRELTLPAEVPAAETPAPGALAPSPAAPTPAATAPSTQGRTHEIEVLGTKLWMDTGIDLLGGSKVRITASGQITYPAEKKGRGKPKGPQTAGPDGLPRGWADMLRHYGVRDAGRGALVGRIGSDEYAQPFLLGAKKEFDVPVGGRLFLGINQGAEDAASAEGSYQAKVEILEQGAAPAAGSSGLAESPIEGITPELLARIPRRIADVDGNPGDMVNGLIVGTEEEMVRAFTTAGWVKVDSSTSDSVVNAVLLTLKKQDYVTMPMSTLYLFGRPQDYGFAHAEPIKVVMARHHLRLWKSEFEIGGRPLWCMAATHDIGLERDQRNNSITHKIDPNIDEEREYVNGTLTGTGLVIQRNHVTPADPLTSARTATGGEFYSDGRILVLVLKKTGVTRGAK